MPPQGSCDVHYRTLAQGLEVSGIGIGCMPMKAGMASYGPADDAESIATIHAAIDLGVTFFDTAEIYGPLENEELLGRAIRGKREGLVVATKWGFRFEDGNRSAGVDGSPANVKRAIEGSLQRLGTDRIDLYYQHRMDPAVPIEETMGALSDLVREGKVLHVGLSEASAATIRRAHAVHPVAAIQTEYSLWERGVEEEILPLTAELGIGFVPYSPLGRGFLAGNAIPRSAMTPSDWRLHDPRYEPGNFEANQAIVDVIRTVADAKGVSLAQVALAWLLAKRPDIVPIPGTKRRVTMADSTAAVDVTLSAGEMARLDAIGRPAGLRYPEQMLAAVNV